MTSKRFTDEFKAEVVKQVSERGYPVREVPKRLSVSSLSLYAWLRERGVSRDARKAQKEVDLVRENARLRVDPNADTQGNGVHSVKGKDARQEPPSVKG